MRRHVCPGVLPLTSCIDFLSSANSFRCTTSNLAVKLEFNFFLQAIQQINWHPNFIRRNWRIGTAISVGHRHAIQTLFKVLRYCGFVHPVFILKAILIMRRHVVPGVVPGGFFTALCTTGVIHHTVHQSSRGNRAGAALNLAP